MTSRRTFIAATFTGLLSISSLLGCAWAATYQIYEGDRRPPSQEAVITSDFGPKTEALVHSKFGHEPTFPTLRGVDEPDEHFYGEMNSTYDWSFEVHLLPGVHQLQVSPSPKAYGDPITNIPFDAEAGHIYVLTQVTVRTEGLKSMIDKSFRWVPVLIDETEGKILFPPPFAQKTVSPP